MKLVYTVLLILIVAAILIFCVQNFENTAVSFFGWGLSLPKAVLVLIAYVLGMLTGGGLWSFLRRSYHRATDKTQ